LIATADFTDILYVERSDAGKKEEKKMVIVRRHERIIRLKPKKFRKVLEPTPLDPFRREKRKKEIRCTCIVNISDSSNYQYNQLQCENNICLKEFN
jgi:hypothetical protein